ncbi:MAG TPA: hypothetical protein VID27_12595, partial [Blastocatellia bacterium]
MPTLTIDLPEKLAKRLADEAKYLHVSEEVRIIKLIDKYVTPREYIRAPRNEEGLKRFQTVLESIPSVRVLSTGAPQDALWWIK